MIPLLNKTAEAATMLRVSRATIRSLIDCGELRAVNIGGPKVNGRKRKRAILRITGESLEEYLGKRSLRVRRV